MGMKVSKASFVKETIPIKKWNIWKLQRSTDVRFPDVSKHLMLVNNCLDKCFINEEKRAIVFRVSLLDCGFICMVNIVWPILNPDRPVTLIFIMMMSRVSSFVLSQWAVFSPDLTLHCKARVRAVAGLLSCARGQDSVFSLATRPYCLGNLTTFYDWCTPSGLPPAVALEVVLWWETFAAFSRIKSFSSAWRKAIVVRREVRYVMIYIKKNTRFWLFRVRANFSRAYKYQISVEILLLPTRNIAVFWSNFKIVSLPLKSSTMTNF